MGWSSRTLLQKGHYKTGAFGLTRNPWSNVGGLVAIFYFFHILELIIFSQYIFPYIFPNNMSFPYIFYFPNWLSLHHFSGRAGEKPATSQALIFQLARLPRLRWQAESRNLRGGGNCHGTLRDQKRRWQHDDVPGFSPKHWEGFQLAMEAFPQQKYGWWRFFVTENPTKIRMMTVPPMTKRKPRNLGCPYNMFNMAFLHHKWQI